MRVLTVARWYPSHDSPGRGSFVADLVRATVGAGVDARVVSFDRVLVRGRPDEREAVRLAARAGLDRVVTPESLFVSRAWGDNPTVPVARIPVVRRPGTGDPVALIEDHLAALRPFLERLVGSWRPDVIHAHTGLPDGIVAAQLGRGLDIPVVVSEHMSTIEAELADPAALERYRELLDPAVGLLAVSPPVAERIARLLGVATDRLGVLPNPVEDAAFPTADPVTRDPNELLWVGSIGQHKGIDVLLRALADLRGRRPNLRLRLIGSERADGDQARLEALAAGLGVGAMVTFDGWLNRTGVAAAMSQAAVFVHPSPSETFGVAAAEAILTGLPVAARPSGGVPWIIDRSGGFGRVADGDDPGSFARAIEAILDGPHGIAAEEARTRLVEAVGASAVARQAIERYEAAIATMDPRSASPVAPGMAAAAHPAAAPLPHVIVATERIQAPGLVAALPVDLQRRLVLVVPPAVPGAPDPAMSGAGMAVGIVESEPIRPGPPKPRGRSPLARLRRALWRAAPTADELLMQAVERAVRRAASSGGAVDVIAIDAPAAALLGDQPLGRVRLAPGSLRWLADRWAAEQDSVPPSP